MYSNIGYNPNPHSSNNPFLTDPTSAHTRFPDINAPSAPSAPSAPFQSFSVGQYAPSPPISYLGQAQSPTFPQQQQQQQQQLYTQQPMFQQSRPFQPSSSFGQHLVTGSSYGYLQSGPGMTSPTATQPALTLAQQQVQNNPGYIAQFDPYSSLNRGWDGTSTVNTPIITSQPPTSPIRSSPSSKPSSSSHPRDYIRTYKSELESWDAYAWKQLFNAFDSLKLAWSNRSDELRAVAGQLQAQVQYAIASGFFPGQAQQELVRIQSVGSRCPPSRSLIHSLLFIRWKRMQTPTSVSAIISCLQGSC